MIIGAGLAGLRTASELRSQNYPGRILLLGAEESPPYDRPPLSSQLLTRTDPVWLAEDLSIDWPDVANEVHLGVRATGLTLGEQSRVHVAGGETFTADDVIISTGSSAINPWPGTLTLTTLDDATRLRGALAGAPKRVVIIGAGWIGVELAHGLAAAGHELTLIEAGIDPLGEHLAHAAAHLRGWLDHIDLRTGTTVNGVDLDSGGGATVHTTQGSGRDSGQSSGHDSVRGDVVITAVGMRPATGWLAGSGIDTDDRGFIPVDDRGRTHTPRGRVWAVGDVAAHSHPVFGEIPGGHWFSALRDPARVAADVAGVELDSGTSPRHAPEVFSDQGEHHVEVLGSLSGTETVIRGEPSEGAWVMFHVREGHLIGAVVANSPRDTSSIRRALARPGLVQITTEELADTSVPLRKLLRR